jgi:hypothetical protein
MKQSEIKTNPESDFIKHLMIYREHLTKQQIQTLKGQAIAGNIYAARKGLVKLLKKQGFLVSLGRE